MFRYQKKTCKTTCRRDWSIRVTDFFGKNKAVDKGYTLVVKIFFVGSWKVKILGLFF